MGKTNKANRTKGNMRPSSSGHVAELLGPTGGFVGFSSLGGKEGSFVPVTGDAADTSVDSDFRVAMRKMLKRDAVTRLKAVQEFGVYCVEKDKDIVKNVLPFWPRLFNRLALDLDRRVRESTHASNGKLLAKVGRDVAPHLRSLMSSWLVGQCDPHAPSASTARDTFERTFPQETKRGEAVMFCKEEVMAYFKDNIFEQTAKSMSESIPTSPEDMESKYEMVISATLQALRLFLQLTKNTNDNIREDMTAIVQNGKFWKYAKNKEPQIRGAWFSLVFCLCQTCPDAFEGLEKKLANTVFGQLSESDPIVAPSVWECALSIAVNREDCWQLVDLPKVVLPQLWALLRGGGRGNASALYPCLLPLLSRLPRETAGSEAFNSQLFSCMAHSLTMDAVKLSTSECDAILCAFFECLQFICCTRLDEKEGPALLTLIIHKEIIPLLSSSIHSANHLAVSGLYPLLSALIATAEKKRMSSVVEGFWQQALIVLEKELRGEGMASLGYFFHCLLQGKDGKKEKRTVRFKDEDDEEATPTDAPTNQSQSPSDKASPEESVPPDPDKTTNQNELLSDGSASLPHIVSFCATLCTDIEKEGCSMGQLRLLEEILTSAGSETLLVHLARAVSHEESFDVPKFVEEYILKWLWKSREDEDCVCVLLNIVLYTCSYFTTQEVSSVLNKCCKVHAGIVEPLLHSGLSLCRQAGFFRDWLASSPPTAAVVQSVRGLVQGGAFFSDTVRPSEVEACLRTVVLCVLDVDNELLLNDASFQDVLSLLNDLSVQLFAAKMAKQNSELALNFIHKVAIAVLNNYKRCWKFDATEKLIYLLFGTSLKDSNLSEYSDNVLPTLFRILDASIQSYCRAKEQVTTESSLILRMATDLNNFMLSLNNQKEASHVKDLCNFLLSSVHKALHSEDSARAIYVCHKLMETILPTTETWKTLKDGLVVNVLPSVLSGQILSPISLDEEFFYPEDTVIRLALACDVTTSVICNNVVEFVGNDIVSHATQLVWGLAFCQGAQKRLETFEESTVKMLEKNCWKLLSVMETKDQETLKETIFDLSLKDVEWAVCLQTLREVFPSCKIQSLCEKHFDSLNMVEGVEKYVTRQVLVPSLLNHKKQMYFEEVMFELRDMVKDTKDLLDKDFCGKMGEVCCYLQGHHLDISENMRDILGEIFRSTAPLFVECDVDDENDLRTMHHLQLESIFCTFHHNFIQEEVWEFFTGRLDALMEKSCRNSLSTPRSLLVLHRTLTLFAFMSDFVVRANERQDEETLLQWKPAPLSEQTQERMLRLFLHVSMQDKKDLLPGACNIILNNIVSCVRFLPASPLLLGCLFLAENGDCLRRTVDLLSSDVRQLQIASHVILSKVMPLLPAHLRREPPQNDEDSEDDEKKDEYEKIPQKLDPQLRSLRFLDDVVASMLADIRVGDACSVLPHTDAHRISLAYLLGWTHVLDYIAASPSQVRQGYATDLSERGLLPSLFVNVFRMMPENPVLLLKKSGTNAPMKDDLKKLFLHPPTLNTGSASSEEIESVACHVFAMALRRVPASIRSWWNGLDRKSADIVNNFTSKYVSSHLCVAEIQAVHENEKQFENLIVQARPGSREVIATYSVDECPLELCVTLPPNHPLGPVVAERRGRGGVGQGEWRGWLMQLTTLLTHQNGSVLDGLGLWQRNLQRKFEGVEECMICYMVLHSTTLKLPRLSCRVCRKKFHSACLYKWFRTSNNSTCPLCRNEFSM